MKKKLIWLMSAAMLGGTVLTACSTKSETQPAAKGTEVQAPSKPIKIEVALRGGKMDAPDDDPLKQGIDKKLNMDLVLTTVNNADYLNQLNVRLAAGNYPDVFEVPSPLNVKDLVDKGLVMDLTPHLDKIKQVLDFQGKEDFDRGKINNKQYAIARDADVPFSSYWIRKDWLDKLGMKAPTNLDELLSVAKAFVEKDPDGNGKKDTYGITGYEFEAFSALFGAFGVGTPESVYVKNGKLTSGANDPAMKDALTYVKKLVDENVLDPEIITNKNNADIDKAFQGKAGIIFKGWTSISRKTSYDKYKSINPNAEWVQMDAPNGPGGKFASTHDYSKAPAYFVVSKSVEKDPQKLQKIFDLLNYVSTDEGLRLVSYGVENKHYKMENGKLIALPLLDEKGANFWFYQIAGRNEMEYLKAKFSYIEKDVQFAIDQPRIKALNGYLYEYPAGFNKADTDRYVNEELIKFMFGKRPISEFDAYVKTLETTYQYNAFMASVDKQLKEKGLLK
jgi:putative aldouronate transport system substrate-binding protein